VYPDIHAENEYRRGVIHHALIYLRIRKGRDESRPYKTSMP